MKNGVKHTARYVHALFSEIKMDIKHIITGKKSHENKMIKRAPFYDFSVVQIFSWVFTHSIPELSASIEKIIIFYRLRLLEA